MLTPRERAGFTLVEVIVALVILATAVLGFASSASQLAMSSATAELRALALEGVEDRLARVRLDPRYGGLDTLYAGVDTDLFGVEGLTRTTSVVHVQTAAPGAVDYRRITVTVTGPLLTPPVSRQIIIAAP